MAKSRKKKTAGKRRGGSSGSSTIGWFLAGIVLGVVGAVFLYSRGFMPALPERTEVKTTTSQDDGAGLLDSSEEVAGAGTSRYDFFTVLPEMEVVVPERELTTQAEPPPTESQQSSPASSEQFVLQVGSFRSAADADQMKARLALLGSVANIQQVTVNDETWHRVRLGPVRGARQADQLRRQLQDNGIDVLVLKGSG